MSYSVIIAAAGKGERAGFKRNKLLERINGKPVILLTAEVFDNLTGIDEIIVTYREGEKEEIQNALKPVKTPLRFVTGGETRFLSVKNALKTAKSPVVLIHDGARPFVTRETVLKCAETAEKFGSAIVTLPCRDTVITTDGFGHAVSSTRKNLCLAATPQGFKTADILRAYELAGDGNGFTDEAGVYIDFIGECKVIEGNPENVKLTYKSDFLSDNSDKTRQADGFSGNAESLRLGGASSAESLRLGGASSAESLCLGGASSKDIRVGTGFDLHKLIAGRDLILGGVKIPHDKGLLGHSDADVLTHAVMDALLSSLSLRDIGYHFSDKDPQYKDISSMVLLKKVMDMITAKGYAVNNVSAVVMAEKPKMSAYVDKISESLAAALNIGKARVGVTLTTLEGIGTVGREEGIAVQAYVSVIKK